MSTPKPIDPVTAELFQLIRMLINRMTPGVSADIIQRIEALEAARTADAAVYPTITPGA